jgi:hypothetical protein
MVQMCKHSRQEHNSKFPQHTRKPCRILRLRKRLRQESLVLVCRAGPGNARECRGQPPDTSSEKSVTPDSCHVKSLSRELLRNRCPLSMAASRTSISCSRVAKYARKSLRCAPAPSSTDAPAPAETSPDRASRSSMAVTAASAVRERKTREKLACSNTRREVLPREVLPRETRARASPVQRSNTRRHI